MLSTRFVRRVSLPRDKVDSFDRYPGLYLFDEPEAALSPQRQLAALER